MSKYNVKTEKKIQMKFTKFIVILSFLILIAAVNAQPRYSPQDRLERLKERLGLTKDQVEKVKKILVKADEEIQKLCASENPDRAEFRKIMGNTNNEIIKVLNKKQKAEYEKMLDERRKRRQENKPSSSN
jgi:Spy/CpxP family protein refolding chaperone